MALRTDSVIDRENVHPKVVKPQLTKQTALTRRPALDEVSNKLGVGRIPSKKEPTKEEKQLKSKLVLKKETSIPKAYSSGQIESIVDIDADSTTDPLLVSEYVTDIYKYLYELEAKYPISPTFLEGHKSTPKMRAILINWLVQVHSNFKFLLETLHLCVSIVDRYLEVNRDVGRNTLQLVGVSSLLIACKYEEVYGPDINDLVYICDKAFTKKQIFQAELEILSSLGCNLGKPLSIHFLRRYNKIAQVRNEEHTLAKYLLELALVDNKFSHIKPSVQAAAACCLSLMILNNAACSSKVWTPTLVRYSNYKYSDFKSTVYSFAAMLLTAGESKHQSVQKKYSSAGYSKISINPKLKGFLVKKLAESVSK